MRRAAVLTAALVLAAAGAPAPMADCAERLDRTLAQMQARPLLKEELATGLMWMRVDARAALERGDAESCLREVETVERLLGLAREER